MLVDVEISRNDDSYEWFLHWMSQYQKSQLSSTSIVLNKAKLKTHKQPSTMTSTSPTPEVSANTQEKGIFNSLLRRLTPGLHHLQIQTSKVALPNGSSHTHFSLIPGPGKHILRYKGTFIQVTRERENRQMDLSSGKPWETIKLTTLYSSRHIFEDMFQEAHALATEAIEGKTIMYNAWGTDWKQFGQPRRKRLLESVVLDKGIKEHVVEDVKDFIGSSRWYLDRGIPYRRGYLLHGPPGSGKSSFIQALAGSLDYNISILNLSERGLTDDRLNHLLTKLPERTIVLLEDIDAAFGNRRSQSDEDGYNGANVTFSGLLNALDGVASAEERIVFLTTNHVERLDPALVRPGRVDMTVRLGEATKWQIGEMWSRFYGDEDSDGVWKKRFLDELEQLGVFEGGEIGKGQASMAALQGLFLYNKGDMEGAIKSASGLIGPGKPA
jgi:mitochondrial chaperone BCS1